MDQRPCPRALLDIGPACTLYMPGPRLKKDENELVIIETDKLHKQHVIFQDHMKLVKTLANL